MKKLLTLLLCIVLAASIFMFSACDKDKEKGGNPAEEAFTEQEINTLLGKVITYALEDEPAAGIAFSTTMSEVLNQSEESNNIEWVIKFGKQTNETFETYAGNLIRFKTEDDAKNFYDEAVSLSEMVKTNPFLQRKGREILSVEKEFNNKLATKENKAESLLSKEFVDMLTRFIKEARTGTADGDTVYFGCDNGVAIVNYYSSKNERFVISAEYLYLQDEESKAHYKDDLAIYNDNVKYVVEEKSEVFFIATKK